MDWYIWLAIILGGILALYFFAALVIHLGYKIYKTKEDFTDKTIFITGGTSGIGRTTVIDMYLRGMNVTFTGRKVHAANEIVQELLKRLRNYKYQEGFISTNTAKMRLDDLIKKSSFGVNENFQSSHLTFYKMDMADFNNVRSVAGKFKQQNQNLDILLNNAGIAVSVERYSKQQYPITMAVNHLAHFLLIHDLMDLLKASPKSRVVNVSTVGHKGVSGISGNPHIDLNDFFNSQPKNWHSGFPSYLQSKFANVMFTRTFARLIEKNGLQMKTTSLHPGSINTDLTREGNLIIKIILKLSYFLMMTPREGAQNNIFNCLHPFSQLVNGGFYDSMKVAKTNPKTDSIQYQNKFWDKTLDLIEAKLGPLTHFKRWNQ